MNEANPNFSVNQSGMTETMETDGSPNVKAVKKLREFSRVEIWFPHFEIGVIYKKNDVHRCFWNFGVNNLELIWVYNFAKMDSLYNLYIIND